MGHCLDGLGFNFQQGYCNYFCVSIFRMALRPKMYLQKWSRFKNSLINLSH